MQEYGYTKYQNPEIISVDNEVFEYQRSSINGDIAGFIESGHVFNQKTKKYFGKIVKSSSYVTLIVFPTETEYNDINIKSAIKRALV